MKPVVVALFVVSFVPLCGAGDRSLAEAAAKLGERLPAGCVVTAELRPGRAEPEFALAGDPGSSDLPPERRVFEIGSISKLFTGLLLAIAVEEGKVRYDSRLDELLDLEFADARVGRITLLQLATHRSGLPRLPDNLGPDPDAMPDPYAEYDRAKLEAYLKRARLPEAGTLPVDYSNLGVGLLGDLIARAYGRSWEELVIGKIATPLGMKDTRVRFEGTDAERIAPPWVNDQPASAWHFDALAGAGALRSTAADMMTFGRALLEPDKTSLAKALGEVTKKRAEAKSMGTDIGLCLLLGRVDGAVEYLHSGGTGGYRSLLEVLPSRGIVRVALINNNAIPAEALLPALRDAGEDARPTVDVGEEQLGEFAGVYELGPSARFTFLVHEGRLHARLTGQPFIPLDALGDDRFRCVGVAADYQFGRGNGEVVSVTLHQNGREIPALRTEAAVPAIRFPSDEALEAFVGTYELSEGKVFTVTASHGTLLAQLSGQPAYPVFQTGDDRFEYDIVDAALEFERDQAGKVTALILDQRGRHRAPRQ